MDYLCKSEKMDFKKIIKFLVFLGILLLLTGCKSNGAPDSQSARTYEKAYEVTDDEGNIVRMPRKPVRIFATHFHLENMLLGVVPQERVVAFSSTMDDPYVSFAEKDEFNKPVRVGYSVPLEQVIAMKPDLIIAREGMGKEMLQTYRELVIPVYVSSMPLTVKEMQEKITGIAAVTGEVEHGRVLNRKISEVLSEIDKRIPAKLQNSKSCLLVCKMNHNYGGKGCMFDDVCHHARIRNAAADMGINNGELISKEVMMKSDPDYFILSLSWELRKGNGDTYKTEFLNDPALRYLHAVQEGHVIYTEDKYLYASNQNCVWAIKKLANIAYGNVFPPEKEYFLKGF